MGEQPLVSINQDVLERLIEGAVTKAVTKAMEKMVVPLLSKVGTREPNVGVAMR